MESALEILLKIEGLSKKVLELIIADQFEALPAILKERKELINSLYKSASVDSDSEKNVLRRIEKLESKMLEVLKNDTTEIRDSINTVSKGKKAVKNGYFKSKGNYEKNNRFSKRG